MAIRYKDPNGHFDSHVEFEANTGCWLWSGKTSGKYGYLQVNGRSVYAHRFAHQRFNGPLAEREDACHRCDTPLCVNPAHLFAGTRSANIRDAVAKGRMTNRNGNRTRGDGHHNSRLTAEQVLAIKADPRTPYKIARDYGVADYTIYCIKRGLTWAHVR